MNGRVWRWLLQLAAGTAPGAREICTFSFSESTVPVSVQGRATRPFYGPLVACGDEYENVVFSVVYSFFRTDRYVHAHTRKFLCFFPINLYVTYISPRQISESWRWRNAYFLYILTVHEHVALTHLLAGQDRDQRYRPDINGH